MKNKQPPFQITNKIIDDVAEISELVGRLSAHDHLSSNPNLRRTNRIRTIHGSLAIEQNTLSLEQVTAVLNGKHVLAPPKDIAEVKNAYEIYERLDDLDPYSVDDLLTAHGIMTRGLVEESGMFRTRPVGVVDQAADLCNYVFFSDNELPKQIAPNTPELSNNKLKEFLLRMSLIYNEGFFAKKVMLIEGSSDMIICRYLCNRLDFNLDVAGSQIIPVEGKGQFPVITKLFRLIGKDVCVLTDLDGFIDDNSVVDLFSSLPKATEIANRRGVSNLQTMIRDIKTTIDKLISENKQDIATIYELHPYWVNRDSEADPDKVIRRALIAQLFTVSEDTLLTWPNSNDWKSIKTRITALYDILEELGCFILRRGAIESYYTFAPNTTFSGKPSAATLEVSHLEEESNAQICEQFADLVRALRFAAIDKPVDESFAVKKELLSELALVIGVLPNTDREEDLLSDIKQAKGNSESLFDYKIINENGRLGVEVFLKSKIINVSGFPFKAFVDDNVNQIVSAHVRMKN